MKVGFQKTAFDHDLVSFKGVMSLNAERVKVPENCQCAKCRARTLPMVSSEEAKALFATARANREAERA